MDRSILARPMFVGAVALLIGVLSFGATDRFWAHFSDNYGYERTLAMLAFFLLVPLALAIVPGLLAHSTRVLVVLALVATLPMALLIADRVSDPLRYDNNVATVRTALVTVFVQTFTQGMFFPLTLAFFQLSFRFLWQDNDAGNAKSTGRRSR